MVHVRSHVKKDGTRVREHSRRSPTSGTPTSGSSFPGGLGIIFILIVLGALGSVFSETGIGNAGSAQAWKAAGFTVTRVTSSDDAACDVHSFGQVQQFLQKHECLALHRELLKAEDHHGNQVLIATSRITMPSLGDAKSLRDLTDRSGTGNITDLARGRSEYNHVSFTGQHYDSGIRGPSVLVAEAEPLTGNVNDATLKTLAVQAVVHQ